MNRGEDRVFNLASVLLLGIIGISAVFPLMFVFSMSITPYAEVLKNGGFIVLPRAITLEGYRQALSNDLIPHSFLITVFVTVVGTAINLVLSTMMAYPLSKKKLPGRSMFLMIVLFTMLFNGGMIPTYLVVKGVGLLDTIWALIVPSAISAFNLLIMKSFFENLPTELFESARIDGAKEWRILMQIVIPLSVPVMLTVGLFYAVQHWNTLFSAIMYVNDRSLFPLQVVLREILIGAQSLDTVEATTQVSTETFKMAAVIISTLPMIVIYPFIQKYFQKGAMLGSVKG